MNNSLISEAEAKTERYFKANKKKINLESKQEKTINSDWCKNAAWKYI